MTEVNALQRVVPTWKLKWWEFLFRRCGQRILIVTDRSGSFDPTGHVSLTELIRVLEGFGDVPAAVPATVTKVSKVDDGFSFAGASPAVTTANYDQVWLFGFQEGPPGSDPAETAVLAQFMEDGGGVFATGDHSTIGQPLCGSLPRIRKMREWAAVPMSGVSRLDTVNPPVGQTSADQSDATPQTTFPLLDGAGAPHPLLRSPANPINVLPDHPHESECYAPRGSDLDDTFAVNGMASFAEFPQLAGQRHGPAIVAVSLSASINSDLGKGPVAPRCFAAISAYDGRLVDRGRVVCDATWHHFVNMNLTDKNPYGKPGLIAGGVPTPAYLQIQRYFANIADYLTPKNRVWCRLLWHFLPELLEYPLIEELIPLPPPPWPPPLPDFPEWPRAVQVGQLAATGIDRKRGNGSASAIVDELLDISQLSEAVMATLHSDTSAAMVGDNRERFDDPAGVEELRNGILGRTLLELRRRVPDDPSALGDAGDALHDEGERFVAEIVQQSVTEGIAYRQAAYQRSLEALRQLR